MKAHKIINCAILAAICYVFNSCGIVDWIQPKPKIQVKGRVVALRNNNPIAGASVMTYRTLFNCGSFCSNYQLVDSTATDVNGYFSFNATEADLELSIFKKNYFGLFPGEGHINKRTQIGGTDYGVISLQPSSRIVVTFASIVNYRDSIYSEYYACGDQVNTPMGGPEVSYKGRKFEWSVEGDCTIDVHTTVYRKGTKTNLKNSFYVPQGVTVYKTIEY